MIERLDPENLALMQKLESQLDRAQPLIDRYELYYEGEQRLEQLGLAIPPELRRFVVIVNWPRVAVDAVEERLERTGFQMPGARSADTRMWDMWLYNGLDELAVMGDRDALKLARSYRIVGANDEDEEFPRITIESPREVTVIRDPKTLEVIAALKRYDAELGRATSATLYLPDETIWLDGSRGAWEVVERDKHLMDRVPVVPQVNRPRIGIPKDGRPLGTSEMVDVIPITDAAARNLTNAQVAQETHSVPQRAVSGAKASDFVDQDGKMLPVWETYFGAVWALTNPDAKPFQFQASDMVNFERMQDMYARQASAMSATPPNYFGLAADDAASADAIRARDARLNRKCERRIQTFSGVDKRTLHIAERIRTGEWNKEILRMRSLWDDPSTPTFAQKADAATKLAGGKPIIPVEQARRDLGYTPQEIADMIEMDKRAASLALEAMQRAMIPGQEQGHPMTAPTLPSSLLTTPLSDPISPEGAERFAAVAALDLWATAEITAVMLSLTVTDIQVQYLSDVMPTAWATLTTAQRRAAQIGEDYVDVAAITEDIPAGPRLKPTSLAGIASDGRDLETLLFQPLIKMLVEEAAGSPFPDVLRTGRNSMNLITTTQIHDAARVAEGTKVASNKRWKGYVRMVEPSACSRCIILAGRTYSWNTGFLRHPNCRCAHIPTSIAAPDVASPRELFDQMSRKEQDRAFTAEGAEAIRLGADPTRVVNVRRGMNTTQTASGREVKQAIDYRGQKGIYITRAGTGTKRQRGEVRLMPESILRFAAGNRDEAIRLLRLHGYIL